ncbi:MAG: hypothetical protein SOZ84_00900 [Treponema sp.]|nr:hypothetical protein [Treponema sp.]
MKNNFLRLVASVSVALVALVAFSCKSSEAAEEPVVEQAPVAQVSQPVESVLVSTSASDWTENVFADASQHGYFFTTAEIGQFSMVEGEFKKSGGYEQSGFGFVFGYTADDEGWLADYLRFEITTAGQYSAYACRGSTYIDLVESNNENTAYRYESSAIKGGYDSVNKLKIERNGDKDYTLYINGSKVASFTAPNGFSNSDGVMAFFSVGKADQEKFPDEPVKVTYRITDSVAAE